MFAFLLVLQGNLLLALARMSAKPFDNDPTSGWRQFVDLRPYATRGFGYRWTSNEFVVFTAFYGEGGTIQDMEEVEIYSKV